MLTVKIERDSDLESPGENDGAWTLYSFGRRHSSFKDPEELGLSLQMKGGLPVVRNPGLQRKLQVGLAHWLSYYEHNGCIWFRKEGHVPCGVEFRWDGVRVAGLLVWEHKPSDMGAKTYEARAKDADGFLQEYTAWCNGGGWYYCIEDEEGECVDSCGGFYGLDYMLDELAMELAGKEFEVSDPEIEGILRHRVQKSAQLQAANKKEVCNV